MATEILHLDTKVTEDFISGMESSNGPTRSTGTHLFLNDLLIARRDPDGQIFAVRKVRASTPVPRSALSTIDAAA